MPRKSQKQKALGKSQGAQNRPAEREDNRTLIQKAITEMAVNTPIFVETDTEEVAEMIIVAEADLVPINADGSYTDEDGSIKTIN